MNKVTFDNMRSSGGIPLDSYWVKYLDVEALQAENKTLKSDVNRAIQMGLGLCDKLDMYKDHETASNMKDRLKSLTPTPTPPKEVE